MNAVHSSKSIRQVLIRLGLSAAGGSYQTIHKLIRTLNIDTSHFTGQRWNKGKTFPHKRKLEDYLSNQFPINSCRLKKRLVAELMLQNRCHNCGLEQWLENPIPLELDHINGNHFDNSISNLRLLCPNCHALTPTYRGKNKGSFS